MEDSTAVCRSLHDSSHLSDSNILAALIDQDVSPAKSLQLANSDASSDEDAGPQRKVRKRLQQFSDSDNEKENKEVNNDKSKLVVSSSDSESEEVPCKSVVTKSRIQLKGSSSDSDEPKEHNTFKNEEQQIRMKNKRDKMKQKFKNLMNSRSKSTTIEYKSDEPSSNDEKSEKSSSGSSDNEISSIGKIKQVNRYIH